MKSILNVQTIQLILLHITCTIHYNNAFSIYSPLKSVSFQAVLTTTAPSKIQKKKQHTTTNTVLQLSSDSNTNSNEFKNSNKNEIVESLKNSLVESWNSDEMGIVPSSPEKAAQAAASALQNAKQEPNGNSIYLIDILLPGYDVTAGSNAYDPFVVIQFCIQLSKYLQEGSREKKQTNIVVRDGDTLRLIQNMLQRQQDNSVRNQVDSNDDDEESSSDSNSTVDSFRQQMLSNWDDDDTDNSETTKDQQFRQQLLSNWDDDDADTQQQHYVINSLFGDEHISTGPDSFDDVLDTLDKLKPIQKDKHETVIIVSACSPEELIAIRRIIALYEKDMTIILFNCKLDRGTYPRELARAEMVYSILPLLAKKQDSPIFSSDASATASTPPKIVVMRRYPHDWEIFIDADNSNKKGSSSGFQLVQSFDLRNDVSSKQLHGPTMDVISDCVKRFLQSTV